MKKFLIITIVFVITGYSIYFGLLTSSSKLDESALFETNKIIEAVEAFHKEYNQFPDDIASFIKLHGLKRVVHFGPFETELSAFIQNGEYFIEYYQFPLGPFHGYCFNTKEWYYAE